MARGREGDNQFTLFTHDSQWPDAAIKGLVLAFQDATFLLVQEGTGNLFFGVVGAVAANDNLTVAELPHYTILVGLTQFFCNFGREKGRFPKTLPAERAAKLAGGTGRF